MRRLLPTVAQDLKFSARVLNRDRAHTLLTVLTIGFGVGVNTAIFALINSVLFRPMPVQAPASFYEIVSPADANAIQQFQQYCKACAGITSAVWALPTLGEAGEGPIIHGNQVEANYFEVLGIGSSMGRVFRPGSDTAADSGIVLNYDFWQRQYGGAPDALGQTLKLSGRSYTIVGAAAKGFIGTMPLVSNFWIVAPTDSEARRALVRGLVRLRPGVTRDQAQDELTSIAVRLAPPASGNATDPERSRIRLQSRRTMIPWNSGTAVMAGLLLAFTALVLLVACANVANLSLARSASRVRETSVRLALGASRSRLIRQLMTESLVLSMLGGVLALVVTAWTLPALSMYIQSLIPNLWGQWRFDLSPDLRVFGFTAGACVLAAIVFGLMPALQSTRLDVASGLKEGGTQTGGRSRSRLRSGLIVVQISVCGILLINAGLLGRALAESYAFSPGFETDGIVIGQLDIPASVTSAKLAERVLSRVAEIPGVDSVAASSHVPLLGYRMSTIAAGGEGLQLPSAVNQVTGGYFATLGIPLIQGRSFTSEEERSNAAVTVISEATAKKLFGRQGALGKSVHLGNADRKPATTDPTRDLTVIGVARDTRSVRLSAIDEAYVYVPLNVGAPARTQHFLIRPRKLAASSQFITAVRKVVAPVDGASQFIVYSFDIVLGFQRLPAQAGSAFAGFLGLMALGLASIGIYGVIAYSVGKRSREIGIRIALGATSGQVRALFIKEGGRLLCVGLVIGAAGGLLTAMALRSVLPGVRAFDSETLAAVTAFLSIVVLTALWSPTSKACRVEPLAALREE
jgi:predicted permease